MLPFVVNGECWRVVRVDPDNPRLIDRTRTRTIATTDPVTRTVNISTTVNPPLLDRVMLHEVAHAITISHGLLDILKIAIPERLRVFVEEWAVQLVENYGIEAATLASTSLGRPICVRGWCH